MIYQVDCYTGTSVLSRQFETLGDVMGFLFDLDIDEVKYDVINLFKYEEENPIPVDFTGNVVDVDL